MIPWTTPSLNCKIPKDLIFDYLIITFLQSNIKIEKTVDFSQVKDGCFTVNFTQEETGKFKKNSCVEAQINFMCDDVVRMGTEIVTLKVCRNLHDEVIGDIPSQTIDITENGHYVVDGFRFVNVDVPQCGGEHYEGSYEVTPSSSEQILETKNKTMIDNLIVNPIPYSVVDNEKGLTVTIGE